MGDVEVAEGRGGRDEVCEGGGGGEPVVARAEVFGCVALGEVEGCDGGVGVGLQG